LPVSSAPLQIQSIIIKYASDALASMNFSAVNSYSNATLSTTSNTDLNQMLLKDFLTCLTSYIQSVWPDSNLTVNSTIINCQPVVPLTIQEFLNIGDAIYNSSFFNDPDKISNAQAHIDRINRLVSPYADYTNATQLSTRSGTKFQFQTHVIYIENFVNRYDFNTTVGTLVERYNNNLSSETRPDLLNMIVNEFLACLANGAPWSANNVSKR
jgi:hypothetical protein